MLTPPSKYPSAKIKNINVNMTNVVLNLNVLGKPFALLALIPHQTPIAATTTIAIAIQSHFRLFLLEFSTLSPL
jgi:hypothetical protein